MQYKSLRINGKPRKIYPDNYLTLKKQFKLLFITKQVPIEKFFLTFSFNLSINEIRVFSFIACNTPAKKL